MLDLAKPTTQAAQQPDVRSGAWDRFKIFMDSFNRRLTYIIGLPIVAALVPVVVGHFQYLSSYQEKVKQVGTEQVSQAEKTFSDVSIKFSKAITLQQILYFNYRDATKTRTDGDASALETKNSRDLYKDYDGLRTELREHIDLLARQVEMTLDWASDPDWDGANPGRVGADPMSRIVLGAYDFDCDSQKYMPNFGPGGSHVELPVPAEMRKENPNATPLGIDWYSAKHQLLTLYYCFDTNHRRIAAARRWAAGSSMIPGEKEKFIDNLPELQNSFDAEAVRLDNFLTLGARRIETIRVKFRPTTWYCSVPIVRQIVDVYSKKCTPIRTAQSTSMS